jgi:hypothetical protein
MYSWNANVTALLLPSHFLFAVVVCGVVGVFAWCVQISQIFLCLIVLWSSKVRGCGSAYLRCCACAWKFTVSLWERPATSSLFQNTKPHRSLANF